MSAPWIKVEHITPDKPEIVELAEFLKIDQDAAFGKCVRIWIWADQQSVDGDRLNVTPSFLDRLTNCPGFSEGLRVVGWLKIRNDRFSIPNFTRHNGQSAKKRALTQERVEKSRNAHSVTEALPEIEIDKRKNKSKVKNILSQVDPGNFLPPKDPDNIQQSVVLLEKSAALQNPRIAFFDDFRKAYPSTKRGIVLEWTDFHKKYGKEVDSILPLLMPALEREKAHAARKEDAGEKYYWKNLPTWINQRWWEAEFGGPVSEPQNQKTVMVGGEEIPLAEYQRRKKEATNA